MLATRRFQFILFFLIIAAQVMGQSNSRSPYSRFGLGIMSQPGFTQNRAMGGAGLAMRDNNRINYLNPASYSAIDTLSFLFDFGLMGNYTYLETNARTDDFWGMNMDHIAISFPLTKWLGMSMGVRPYSKVGYSIKQEDDSPALIDYVYTGNGGINQFYLGTSINIFKVLSLGVNFKYLFGAIDLTRSVQFPFESTYAYTEVQSRTVIKDFVVDMGIQYSQDFSDKYNLTAGVVFDNRTKVRATNSVTKSNFFPGTAAQVNDSTVVDPEFVLDESSKTGNIVIPTNFGAGFTFNINKKLRIAFDYYTQDWSKSSFFNSDEPLTNSSSFHGGLELIPDPMALKGYHKRMAYRLGGHLTNSYLRLEGEQLKDYGISFGVGLPLKNTRSTFNFAVEGGRRGTLENNLILENYLFVSFSVTLHDFWFIKRKFD